MNEPLLMLPAPKETPVKPEVVKANGVFQRNDVALNSAIALTLRQRILDGLTVYPEKEPIEVKMENGEVVFVHHYQVSAWVNRGNVIPENGRVLRDFLNEARETYRVEKELARQTNIREQAEAGLEFLLTMKTGNKMVVKRYKKTEDGYKETGKTVTDFHQDPKLVAEKVKGIMFGLERLNPGVYAQKSSTTNTHLHLTMGDLRRAKEAKDMARELQTV